MDFELPDGTTLSLADGATGADAAAAIGPGLARAALAVKVDGELRDLARPLPDGDGTGPAKLEILTERSGDDALELIRHDAAHVLAAAVLELYPGRQDLDRPADRGRLLLRLRVPRRGDVVSDADFPSGSRRGCASTSTADEPFVREDVHARTHALERFRAEGQDYKVELIDDLVAQTDPADPLRPSRCTPTARSPTCAAARTRRAPSASRRSSCSRSPARTGAATPPTPMLTRVYGTAFFSKQGARGAPRAARAAPAPTTTAGSARSSACSRSRRSSPGAAFWLPGGHRGVQLAGRAQPRDGPRRAATPRSRPRSSTTARCGRPPGHWDKYRDNMFVTEYEDRSMALKPMNCPGHCQLYSLQRHSYRDLPVRYSEPGLLHRNEPSGALHGLLRVRHFAQDDAHIFCTEEQIQDEVAALPGVRVRDLRGVRPRRPPRAVDPSRRADRLRRACGTEAKAALAQALESMGLEYDLNEGDGAFYGPKIDLHMTDSLGRSWQIGTVQLDYNMPERFELTYTGADNAEHRPVMIHRALMGSYERFIGILLEHLEGELPLWLAPVQAIVLPIADRHNDVRPTRSSSGCAAAGVRAELDDRTESVGRKIRDAELRKIPYMLVVGDREQEASEVAVREHRRGDEGSIAVEEFVERLDGEVSAASADPTINPARRPKCAAILASR